MMKGNERLLRLLVDNTLDLLITYTPGGTITFANQACEKALGYRLQELIGMDAYQLIHPEDRQRVVEEYHRPALFGHNVETQAYRMLRRDGSALYLETLVQPICDDEGRVVNIVTSSRDVTARHLMQQRLDAALQELQYEKIALEQHAIISITDPAGIITYANDKFCAVTQYPRSELIGQQHRLLNSGHHPAAFFQDMWETIRQGHVWQGEICNRGRGGKLFWVQTTVVPFLDGQGVPYQYVAIRSDVTHVKEAREVLQRDESRLEQLVAERTRQLQAQYQELQALNRKLQDAELQLLQSEKLAAVGQLAAGVAHEINNPIGYVSANLGTLRHYLGQLLALVESYEAIEHLLDADMQARLAANKQQCDLEHLRRDLSDLLAESQEGVSRVRAIVQDLRNFTRADAQESWQRTDLQHCLDSTLCLARHALHEGIEVRREYGGVPAVECVPSRINQVLMNLLVNATQAIGRQGVIQVRTQRVGEMVCVEIEDDGCGITAEHRTRLFDPFFTTKPVGQGTGLGLALSLGIVRQHHGRIEVESTVGQGSRFQVWLPLRQPQVGSERPCLRLVEGTHGDHRQLQGGKP